MIIDLSLALSTIGPEHDQPKISYINHKKGAFLLNLAGLLYKGGNIAKKLFLYLIGVYRIKEWPDGLGLAWEEVTMDTHAGTHLDAPYHFGPTTEGKPSKRIDEIPLEWCFSDGVVLDMTNKEPGSFITPDDVQAALKKIGYRIKPYDIILIMTGADKYNKEKRYLVDYPGMSREATLWLIEQGVKIIGIDAVGFDRAWGRMFEDYLNTKDKSVLWPAHFAGRKREYLHIEKMANLDKIPKPHGFKVACFPVKVEKGSAGWCRAVAIVEEK
ncbi:cyclase family protein [bacterium]|nr:cyclase family protein [bacterium]